MEIISKCNLKILSSKYSSNSETPCLFLLPFLNSFQALSKFDILAILCNKFSEVVPPPRKSTDISIIHSIKQVYIVIYQAGKKLPKSDKLGIHAYVERIAQETISFIIQAYFIEKSKRLEILEKIRILLETLKHFVRLEHELKIIEEKPYIRIEKLIVETSKMTNGWIKYMENQTYTKTPTL